jgi:hypothetical protein
MLKQVSISAYLKSSTGSGSTAVAPLDASAQAISGALANFILVHRHSPIGGIAFPDFGAHGASSCSTRVIQKAIPVGIASSLKS